MFTGLITDVGELVAREDGVFRIRSGYPAADISIGASIACGGVCLTATVIEADAKGCLFTVDVSNETLSKTTLGDWQAGRKVNLERSMTAGGELGGHVVTGHVDGVAKITDIRPDGESQRFMFEVPENLSMYIAPKGSVALDGTSLTVNEVAGNTFGVNLIPHSLEVTTWGDAKVGGPHQPRGRSFCALCGAPVGVPPVSADTNDMKTVAYAEGKGFLSPTAEIVDDMRNGRMVILVDAEDRENEGDLVIPAQMATPDAINFMAKHGRGLICLSLTEKRAKELELASMVPTNASRTGTAFTVSIEAREGVTTGISAHDRSRTILAAIDSANGADDIVSPGHVFPLIARDGGVLARAGHTEASVDMARMAGLNASAVICEIMNDDGSMSRLPELVAFAQQHGLKIGTIEDLIAYRLRNERIVKEVSHRVIQSRFGGDFTLHVYERDGVEVEHLALVKGDLSGDEPVLVRVHSINFLSDVLGYGGSAYSDASKIELAMAAIANEGRGVIVIIREHSRKVVSETLSNATDSAVRKAQANEKRNVEIGIGSQILRDLGVTDMVLLTNSPQSVYVGLEAYGLKVVDQRPIE